MPKSTPHKLHIVPAEQGQAKQRCKIKDREDSVVVFLCYVSSKRIKKYIYTPVDHLHSAHVSMIMILTVVVPS